MSYEDWKIDGCADILSASDLSEHQAWASTEHALKWVVTSGGFDPIHPGHISCIVDSQKYGDLAVVVNGDTFLRTKKGKPFLDLKTRCQIVSAIRGVKWVVPFEIENDQTVCAALAELRPTYFTKGGDRIDAATIPEWDICQKYGIQIVTGVGLPKAWSSSDFLKRANP